jgi:dTDP-4-dehydrorhamnose 3,5-epimerase
VLFEELPVVGAYLVEVEPHRDERGFFARTWSADEFRSRGLNPALVECSISFNDLAGTLRGMHFQTAPHEEAKLVRCTQGSIFDVVIDLRPASPTYRGFASLGLSAADRKALYVPEGCAHGFQTLEDDTEVLYQISHAHVPEAANGVRWDDPAFAIPWPRPPSRLSRRDAEYPDFAG